MCVVWTILILAAAGCNDDGGADGGASGTGSSTGGSSTVATPTTSGASEGTTAGDPCPLLPEVVDEDLSVGPGCIRLQRSVVTAGATLTIVADTEVMVEAGGFLNVSPNNGAATLVIAGQTDAPVHFRSAAAEPGAGDWQCVRIGSGGSASRVEWAVFEHGGQGCMASGDQPETTLDIHAALDTFSDNQVRASAGHGVILGDDAPVRAFARNTFADNARASLRVAPAALLHVDGDQVFVDADDRVEIEGTFDAVDEPGTWSAQTVPYLIPAYLEISGDGDVAIAAGTVVELDGGSLEVFAGKLHIAGTAQAPVRFTSARAAPQAGDWGCVIYSSVTSPPLIEHAVFEYAGNGERCSGAKYKAGLVGPETMSITGSTFREISGPAILSTGICDPAWCDNTFESPDPIFSCSDAAPVCP
ncbi:MAG: hypothetical protein H0T76_04535 [Nannocystis sp.]|nr:hypothetical protein [Nannocystis sp.]MBA3545730.1 hypothetical protein [Nannocystis sp.]